MTYSRFRISPLTRAEIEIIRAGHRNHRPAADVASEVGCTARNIRKYYWRFNQAAGYEPKRPAKSKPRPEKKPPPELRAPPTSRAERFYHSNFEPS